MGFKVEYREQGSNWRRVLGRTGQILDMLHGRELYRRSWAGFGVQGRTGSVPGFRQAKLQARLSQQGPLHPNQTLSAQHRSANTPFVGFATLVLRVLARVITKC